MLSESQFTDYCNRLTFPPAGLKCLSLARMSGPTRRVGGGGGNVTARYPSAKMQRVITAESHRVELSLVYLMEYDPTVLEFYDQPPQIRLRFLSQTQREVSVLHTPDFLVIHEDAAGWVECKPLDRLEQLAASTPGRYFLDDKGQWRCPPGELVAPEHGFFYRVWSPTERDQVLVRNFRFLQDYFASNYPELPNGIRDRIVGVVRREPGISVSDVGVRMAADSLDDVYRLIATGEIYADLEALPLAQPERVRVFANRATAQAYELVQDEIDRVGQGPSGKTLRQPPLPSQLSPVLPPSASVETSTATLNAAGQKLLRGADARELEVANRRFALLKEPSIDPNFSPRTRRRWLMLYRKAEVNYGSGYVGLIPRFRDRGNHSPRLDPSVVELADSVIESQYRSASGRMKMSAYGAFRLACEERGCICPSYQWFTQHVEKWLSRRAEGTAAFAGPVTPDAGPAQDVHGDWPWDTAHIDHYLCDIEVVCAETGLVLGKPWLSLLFDVCCRKALAMWLYFEHPSYRSCLMITRDCVRRHQRLPSCILFDGGKEFESEFFESLAATYGVTLKRRPTAKAHFGSVIERFLGSLKTMFFANLAGSTVAHANADAREVRVQAKENAVWTLERLHELLNEFLFRIYEQRLHPSLGMSPSEAFGKRNATGGKRPTREIAYDEPFIIQTLPLIPRGVARIQPNQGVKVNRVYYWCADMKDRMLHGQSVPVRYDPFNIAVVYVYLNKQWTRCTSRYARELHGHTETELKLASVRILQRGLQADRRKEVDGKALAEFFKSLEGEERSRRDDLRRLAERRLRATVAGEREPHDTVVESPELPGASPESTGSNRPRPRAVRSSVGQQLARARADLLTTCQRAQNPPADEPTQPNFEI